MKSSLSPPVLQTRPPHLLVMDSEFVPQPEHRSNQPGSGGGGISVSVSHAAPGVGASPDRELLRSLAVRIDKVANSMRLNNEYRAELHQCREVREYSLDDCGTDESLAQYVCDLSPAFQGILIMVEASILKTCQHSDELRAEVAQIKAQLDMVTAQVAKRFVLTQEQQVRTYEASMCTISLDART